MILDGIEAKPTPANWRAAEHLLREHTGGKAVVWSGRAATALYHAYQVAARLRPDVAQPEIIMPAMMCTTAAITALMAGMVPRFADVDAHTGLVTLEHIRARLTENTIAVVAIHLLGHTVEIAPIAHLCQAHNLLLIEDLAQALGATYPDGTRAGSVGDVAVYSFNRTKIIETGNGALVANTDEAAATLDQMVRDHPLPPVPAMTTLKQLALSYRNLHHSLVGVLRLRAQTSETVSSAFLPIRPAYDPLYLRPANPDAPMSAALDDLAATLMRRCDLAEIYAQQLADGPWHLLTAYRSSGVCWRFTLLSDDPDQLVDFSEAVRRDGFHVSNLYWPVDQFFRPDEACPNADWFARRVVNLWVDASVDADYVLGCCESLRAHAHRLKPMDAMR